VSARQHDAACGTPNRHRYITKSVEYTWLVSHGGYAPFRMSENSCQTVRIVHPIQTPEIVRMHRPFAAVAVLSAAAAVLALAGCGSSSTSPKQTNFKSLSQAQQQEFEQVAVQVVTGDIASFTTLSPYGAFGFQRVAEKRIGAGYALAGRTGPRFQTSNCPAFSGNTSDEDGDGVPDADSVVWANTCSGLQGYFAYGDPTPNTADVDVNFAANLTTSETTSGETISGTFGGTSSLTQGTGAVDETGAWNYDFSITGSNSSNNGTFKLGVNETASYTYGGAALTSFGSLPPGTFSVNGNWNWVVQTSSVNVNLSFTVSTPTPLSINTSSCTNNPEGVQSGEVDIKFSDGTVVKAVWLNCPGTPSTTVS
jgi:hypothetical protein